MFSDFFFSVLSKYIIENEIYDFNCICPSYFHFSPTDLCLIFLYPGVARIIQYRVEHLYEL